MAAAPSVVVISGNNARKTEYITKSIDAGFNVLADKPMVIRPSDYAQLEADFAKAKEKGVLLYDIMTERFEITTMLQRELSQQPKLFGTLEKGTPDNPSITKISVHNFSKIVAGAQLKRPQWFFDPEQQGAGIVDVTTHLVDLVQWEAFPEVTLVARGCEGAEGAALDHAAHARAVRPVTGAKEFPAFLNALREGRRAAGAGQRRVHLHVERCARAGVGDLGFRGAAGRGRHALLRHARHARRRSRSGRARSRVTNRCCTSSAPRP